MNNHHVPTLRASYDDPDYWVTCSCGWETERFLSTSEAYLSYYDLHTTAVAQ